MGPDGRLTGDVLITFVSRAEAVRAVAERTNKALSCNGAESRVELGLAVA